MHNSVFVIEEEVYKLFEVDFVIGLYAGNFNHGIHLLVTYLLPQQAKHFFKVIRAYISLSV